MSSISPESVYDTAAQLGTGFGDPSNPTSCASCATRFLTAVLASQREDVIPALRMCFEFWDNVLNFLLVRRTRDANDDVERKLQANLDSCAEACIPSGRSLLTLLADRICFFLILILSYGKQAPLTRVIRNKQLDQTLFPSNVDALVPHGHEQTAYCLVTWAAEMLSPAPLDLLAYLLEVKDFQPHLLQYLNREEVRKTLVWLSVNHLLSVDAEVKVLRLQGAPLNAPFGRAIPENYRTNWHGAHAGLHFVLNILGESEDICTFAKGYEQLMLGAFGQYADVLDVSCNAMLIISRLSLTLAKAQSKGPEDLHSKIQTRLRFTSTWPEALSFLWEEGANTRCGCGNLAQSSLDGTKACSNCRSVYYCSWGCQRKDWNKGHSVPWLQGRSFPHKHACKHLTRARTVWSRGSSAVQFCEQFWKLDWSQEDQVTLFAWIVTYTNYYTGEQAQLLLKDVFQRPATEILRDVTLDADPASSS